MDKPLTTARFAGLHGLWHPHATAKIAFGARAFVQCRAVLPCVRAVRERIPDAGLVQTERTALPVARRR